MKKESKKIYEYLDKFGLDNIIVNGEHLSSSPFHSNKHRSFSYPGGSLSSPVYKVRSLDDFTLETNEVLLLKLHFARCRLANNSVESCHVSLHYINGKVDFEDTALFDVFVPNIDVGSDLEAEKLLSDAVTAVFHAMALKRAQDGSIVCFNSKIELEKLKEFHSKNLPAQFVVGHLLLDQGVEVPVITDELREQLKEIGISQAELLEFEGNLDYSVHAAMRNRKLSNQ